MFKAINAFESARLLDTKATAVPDASVLLGAQNFGDFLEVDISTSASGLPEHTSLFDGIGVEAPQTQGTTEPVWIEDEPIQTQDFVLNHILVDKELIVRGSTSDNHPVGEAHANPEGVEDDALPTLTLARQQPELKHEVTQFGLSSKPQIQEGEELADGARFASKENGDVPRPFTPSVSTPTISSDGPDQDPIAVVQPRIMLGLPAIQQAVVPGVQEQRIGADASERDVPATPASKRGTTSAIDPSSTSQKTQDPVPSAQVKSSSRALPATEMFSATVSSSAGDNAVDGPKILVFAKETPVQVRELLGAGHANPVANGLALLANDAGIRHPHHQGKEQPIEEAKQGLQSVPTVVKHQPGPVSGLPAAEPALSNAASAIVSETGTHGPTIEDLSNKTTSKPSRLHDWVAGNQDPFVPRVSLTQANLGPINSTPSNLEQEFASFSLPDTSSPVANFSAKSASGPAQSAVVPAASTLQSFPNVVASFVQNTNVERTIEITLQPEELGKVRMVLQPGENAISISITTERSETLETLRRNIDQLAMQLKELGYQKLDFSFADDKGFGSTDAGSGKPSPSNEEELEDIENNHPQSRDPGPMHHGRLNIRI